MDQKHYGYVDEILDVVDDYCRENGISLRGFGLLCGDSQKSNSIHNIISHLRHGKHKGLTVNTLLKIQRVVDFDFNLLKKGNL